MKLPFFSPRIQGRTVSFLASALCEPIFYRCERAIGANLKRHGRLDRELVCLVVSILVCHWLEHASEAGTLGRVKVK